MKHQFNTWAWSVSAAILMTLGTAVAQAAFPERPISLVVPFAAGSPTDVVGGMIAIPMGKALGLAAPVDGVTPGTGDLAQLLLDAQRSRRGGFGAKLCIHPDQVAVVNAALGPTSAELDWARRVLAHSARTGEGVSLSQVSGVRHLCPRLCPRLVR